MIKKDYIPVSAAAALVLALCFAALFLSHDDLAGASDEMRHFMVFEDVSQNYDLATVSDPAFAGQFYSYADADLSLGVSASVFWIRFPLPDAAVIAAGDGVLELANPGISWIRLYFPIETDGRLQYIEKTGGQCRRPVLHDVWSTDWAFAVPANYAAGQDVFLQVKSISALRLPVVFWSVKDFSRFLIRENFFYGLFYGVLLAMLLYNLFIAFALRDRTYSFYVCYMFFMLLYQLDTHGHLALWLQWPPGIYNVLFWLGLTAAFVFSILFSNSFLQLHKTSRVYARLVKGLLAMALLFGLLGLVGLDLWANLLSRVLGLLETFMFLVLAGLRWRQGFKPALFYLIAWGTLAMGILIWILSPSRIQSEQLLMVCTAMESILLSLALSDRFKTLQSKELTLLRNVHYYHDLSLLDELTGLYNRRAMEIRVSQEIAQALLHGQPLSFAIMDIDFFKKYNDTYGHWSGDQVLKRFSKILSAMVQPPQTAFRFGGEEFVVLLPEMSPERGLVLVDQIRRQLASERFIGPDQVPVRVTVSGGITGFQRTDSLMTLLQRADQALYRAKDAGRNQILMSRNG